VPRNKNQMGIVYTNKINNIKDYTDSSHNGIMYNTQCIPWGATTGWGSNSKGKKSWVRIEKFDGCPGENNLANEKGVYSDTLELPPFLPKFEDKYLFDLIDGKWSYDEVTSSSLPDLTTSRFFNANKAPNIGSVKVSDNGKYDIGEVNSFSLSRNIFYGGRWYSKRKYKYDSKES